jgi:hypothetical protein
MSLSDCPAFHHSQSRDRNVHPAALEFLVAILNSAEQNTTTNMLSCGLRAFSKIRESRRGPKSRSQRTVMSIAYCDPIGTPNWRRMWQEPLRDLRRGS